MRWETTRGCPYSCSFCQHRDPASWRSSNKSWTKIQHAQRDRILAEIEWFVENGVKDVAVLDPTFNTTNGDTVLDFRAPWVFGENKFSVPSGASDSCIFRSGGIAE